MSANFNPNIEPYKVTGSFKFWCQKVLPMVYDDSLSYYETLCKVVNYLNDVIENADGLHDDIVNIASSFDQLQTYVNNYFDDLDISSEINHKLDVMAEDGTLSALIAPYVNTDVTNQIGGVVADQIGDTVASQIGNTVARQIDGVVADQLPSAIQMDVGSATTSWLNENVDPVGSAVIVDSSLSISGAAADAKVTGDKINSAMSNLAHITKVNPIEYIKGKYVETTNPLTMDDGRPITTGESAAWKCAIIACNAGDIFTINGASNNANLRGWFFATSLGVYISESANPFSENDDLILTAPTNAAWLILNSNDLDCESYYGKTIADQFEDVYTETSDLETTDSKIINSYTTNVTSIQIPELTFSNVQMLNGVVESSAVRKSVICKITPNTYINIKKLQSRYCAIGFTSVYPNVGVTLTGYSSYSGVVNKDIGRQSGSTDHYMIATYFTNGQDQYTDAQMQAAMKVYYSCADYAKYEMIAHADDHMINLLKYRPVGKLDKPYIAISCDDGNAVLATYTIPRIHEWYQTYGIKIPVTFGLMDNSAIFSNPYYQELVIDAIEHYDCAVAIHGAQSYLLYPTRKMLMDYILKNQEFLTEELLYAPNAVIYPEHQYNDFIQTFCGSLYNACGCGGIKYNYVYRDTADRPFYIGAKSNCYEIYRLAIHDTRITSLDDVEDIVDYAYDNNYIICPYFHDVDLGDDAPNKDYLRAVLDKFVSYGLSKGIEFVKLGDIPNLL